MTFPERLRTLRLSNGITVQDASRNAKVSATSWNKWERGDVTPKLWRGHDIASALNVPVIALFTDELAIADVVLGSVTLADIRTNGRPACEAAAQRLAAQLEPAIWQAATRPAVSTRPGARAKPRRTRVEQLADLHAVTKSRKHGSQPIT